MRLVEVYIAANGWDDTETPNTAQGLRVGYL